MHSELRHMVKMFTDTSDTSLFKVEYSLHVFVKHQSKLEFGMGNFVSFPIEIYHEQQNLPWVSTKEQTWQMAQKIADWSPQIIYSEAQLHCEKNADGSWRGVCVSGSNVSNNSNIIAQNMPAMGQ